MPDLARAVHDARRVCELNALRHLPDWSVAAAKLGIHVNTLRYRLARIEKHTGRDLDSMADRADFYLALRSRAIAPPHT
jgi:DNA-binding PucR family transcriptional regulator